MKTKILDTIIVISAVTCIVLFVTGIILSVVSIEIHDKMPKIKDFNKDYKTIVCHVIRVGRIFASECKNTVYYTKSVNGYLSIEFDNVTDNQIKKIPDVRYLSKKQTIRELLLISMGGFLLFILIGGGLNKYNKK